MGFSAVAAVVAATAVYTQDKQRSAQNTAADQQEEQAKKDATAADQANNKTNQQHPDSSALLSANQAGGKNGISGTMLTGNTGVDPSLLQLGKTTLLGS